MFYKNLRCGCCIKQNEALKKGDLKECADKNRADKNRADKNRAYGLNCCKEKTICKDYINDCGKR